MISATKKWIFLNISGVLLVPLMTWFILNFTMIYDKEYLVHLCPANVLDGEGAYYLSTFEAALAFMIDMKLYL